MEKRKISMLAYGGVLTGLVLVSTMFIQVPNTQGGYVNLGDGIIFASAMILGPFAGVVGALGSVMADLFAGYPHYAPATFVIKGLMGLVAGLLLTKGRHRNYFYTALVFLICEGIMVGGYFAYESVLFGVPLAVASVFPNIFQAIAGIAVGLAGIPIVRKIFESEKWNI